MTQKISITFKEFLESGKLNGITVGSTMDDVLMNWGEPEAKTVPYPKRGKSKGSAVAWKYGVVEVGFFLGSVQYFGFSLTYSELPEWLHIQGYFPSMGSTLNTFLEYLDNEKITHSIYKPLTFDPEFPALLLGIGATAVLFNNKTIASIYFSETTQLLQS